MTDQATPTRKPRRMARAPGSDTSPTPAPQAVGSPRNGKTQSKSSKLFELLKRERGATLDQMVEATGWLPHTTRAALTGFRKKGHVIARSKQDGVSRYTLAGASE